MEEIEEFIVNEAIFVLRQANVPWSGISEEAKAFFTTLELAREKERSEHYKRLWEEATGAMPTANLGNPAQGQTARIQPELDEKEKDLEQLRLRLSNLGSGDHTALQQLRINFAMKEEELKGVTAELQRVKSSFASKDIELRQANSKSLDFELANSQLKL